MMVSISRYKRQNIAAKLKVSQSNDMKANIKPAATVDEYIERISDDPTRALMEKVRKAIISSAPKATEVISYGMPGYKLDGMLVYFAAFTNHCSLFPASKKVIEDHKKELSGFKTSKGTIQFTLENPLPIALIKKIVKQRVRENGEKAMLKRMAK
jgi:uncharacterized protein YdhG (YjbR/CyaY superfamily)